MFPVWPRQHLTVPDNRTGFALPFEAYPATLSHDIDAWCAWLRGTHPCPEPPFKPLSETSVQTRRRQIRAWLGALVLEGVSPEELTNLAAMVAPTRARLALKFFAKRSGHEQSFHLHQLMGMVLAIARHWAKLPDTDIDQLKNMEKRCRPEAAGMTSRNMARLRQLDDPKSLRAFATLPNDLMDRGARAGKGSVHSALLVQTAVVIDLLLAVPMRLRNLAALRIGTHLQCWNDARISLSVPAGEVKNKVPIEARLPADLSKRIRIYVDRYRPLLAANNGDWLFPGAKRGAHKGEDGLRTQLKKALAVHVGVQFNPHLYRHFAAYLILRNNPGAYGQVQRVLGYKDYHSTMTFYSGLETPAALDHLDSLLDRERRPLILPPTSSNRRGRN
jgi:integrase